MDDRFQNNGFLSSEVDQNIVPRIRSEIETWFTLAEKTNHALMQLAHEATSLVKTSSNDPSAVAVRVLLRSIGMFQGSVLLLERGMTAEARTLARNVLEGAFAVAALLKEPSKFVVMLQEDSEKSRRMQARFISEKRLVTDPSTLSKLNDLLSQPGKPDYINQKAVASGGALLTQYLDYQRLSDDSTHVTARSLNRHVLKKDEGWCYQWGPGDAEENATTLNQVLSAAISIGIGISELIKHSKGASEFTDLAELYAAMPPVKPI